MCFAPTAIVPNRKAASMSRAWLWWMQITTPSGRTFQEVKVYLEYFFQKDMVHFEIITHH